MTNRKFLAFKSTVDLESILNRQFSNAAILPLENGPLSGTVGVIRLPNISLNIVNVNLPIAIHADRSLDKIFFLLTCCTPLICLLPASRHKVLALIPQHCLGSIQI